MVATEYIPAWHRSKAVPADISEPSPGEQLPHTRSGLKPMQSMVEPPRPLHHYQQWHGHTAPAPHRPIVSPMLVGQRQIGTSLPPAHPEPSSYLISQLPYLMARLEEESLVTGQGYRTWTTDVLADESPTHSSKNISLKRRDGC
ncbi:hypothetical protein BD414DRAFT_485002 [Trametes punicea]|nr:hypothetical protein BD414DRAFT_485002 [Trametes punicea]